MPSISSLCPGQLDWGSHNICLRPIGAETNLHLLRGHLLPAVDADFRTHGALLLLVMLQHVTLDVLSTLSALDLSVSTLRQVGLEGGREVREGGR